jgi:hypothetical protein
MECWKGRDGWTDENGVMERREALQEQSLGRSVTEP